MGDLELESSEVDPAAALNYPMVLMRRLFETGRLLIDCCAEQGALRPGREGWRSAVRVRALHARVRRRLLLRGASGGEAWDCARDGVPINQEDQAATLLAFSCRMVSGQ